MIRSLAAAALLLCAGAPSAQTDTVHTFQVRGGAVYLDGRHLPDAVPQDLDLSGQETRVLEFSGPVTPVLEVNGRAYVLEGERLVLLSESSLAGQGVLVREANRTNRPSADQAIPVVEEAYMRDVATRNAGLYDRMRRERDMETEVDRLAARVRGLAPGAPRSALRDQLRGLLSDLLALKHEVRAEEIAVAEQRLEAARQTLAYREGHHDEIVDARLQELVGTD